MLQNRTSLLFKEMLNFPDCTYETNNTCKCCKNSLRNIHITASNVCKSIYETKNVAAELTTKFHVDFGCFLIVRRILVQACILPWMLVLVLQYPKRTVPFYEIVCPHTFQCNPIRVFGHSYLAFFWVFGRDRKH